MERVLKQTHFKSIIVLVLFFLASAQSSFATTVIIPSDDDMVIGARAILRGKVVAIESSIDEQTNRIYTYITVKVREVLKGQIAERRIVLKELGGQVGDRTSLIYGNPQFKKGERVLLYLDTWADGSLRTYQMFLGKFNIEQDPISGEEIAVRSSPDENTTVLKNQLHGHGAPGRSTERQELSQYILMVRNRLEANWERSVQFEAEAYGNKPMLAEPTEYGSLAGKGDINPNFSFLGPFRFFEPDSGQPVSLMLNPNASSQQGVPQVTLNSADVAAAGSAWSNVSGCSLQVLYGGPLDQCYNGAGTPGVHVVSNNCDGRNSPTTGCAGILAWGGVSQTGALTRTINGTTFRQTIQGFVSMNPWASCHFGVSCNVREILTHEIGHALGLGHSQFSDATMAAFAHFDGRCASIRTDDTDGIRAIYPGSGGGPGPLTIVTSALGGGTVGTAYSQTLSASGGTLPYTWSLVQGQGTLPPGLGLSNGGVITGSPTTAGTYNFTVRVTDSVPATVQKALGIVVSAAGGGGALNSQFVSQTVPTSLQPGQGFTVSMKFLNTGTQTWSGSQYYFASQNPPLNQTWGGNGVSLSGFIAGPGEQMDVNFSATAPSTPGTYNFQWQMYQNGGVGFFGQISTNVAINVGTSTPRTSFDFDGDGKTDVAVWHPGDGTWYIINSGDGSTRIVQWGASGLPYNIPVPADYDGDRKTDIAVWHPGDGTWYIINSSNGSTRVVQWGSSPEPYNVPVPADYDGDGKADIAVWHPGDGTWYIMNSSNGSTRIVKWGASGQPFNIPVPADYDGDGKADIAVWHPGDGMWFIINSSNGSTRIVQWGAGGLPYSMPVPADYDGDGKADIAVWNPGSGYWYVINSANGTTMTKQWGSSPTLYSSPVSADYDGDRKADIAVWHPGDGTWYIVNSSNGSTRIQQWGASGLPYNIAAPAR